jgi:hypothetical protein
MNAVFGISNLLCKCLQQKDQDILGALDALQSTQAELSKLRNDGWLNFLERVTEFCTRHEIELPNLEEPYAPAGRSRRTQELVTNYQHFKVNIFNDVLDHQMQELSHQFTDSSMTLLRLVSSFNPRDNFRAFNADCLHRLASEYYADDFNALELEDLKFELIHYKNYVTSTTTFEDVSNTAELLQRLVSSNKHEQFSLVTRLLTLVLTLPVSTSSVERSFSSMSFVKNLMRNRMRSDWLNALLLLKIEADVANDISDDEIISRFQIMGPRRGRVV